MASPRKLKRQLIEAHTDKEQVRKKLKALQQSNRRLKQRLQTLAEVVADLRKKEIITSNCSELLSAFGDGVQSEIYKRCAGDRGPMSSQLKAFAATLHFYSVKAYDLVRTAFCQALPHPSTIRFWYARVDADPGFTRCAFEAMSVRVQAAAEQKRTVVVSVMVNNMSFRQHVEWSGNKYSGYVDIGSYAPQTEESRVAKEAFVVMAVAVNAHWKAPLGYFLIDGLNGEERANIINMCLDRLHDCGVTVCSLTCDGPSANFSMFRALGANLHVGPDFRPLFTHPCTGSDIHVLFGACHMLKLVRNCFGDTKVLVSPSGEAIWWSKLVALNKVQENEGLRLGSKLRPAHVQYQKQRMKVNLGAQLLSASVADALHYLCCVVKDRAFQGSEGTIEFIRVFNDLFDVLNPVAKGSKAPMKQCNRDNWQNILTRAENYIVQLKDESGERIVLSRRKTAFIGFLCAIRSVRNIF